MRNDPKTLFMTLYKTHTSEITRRGPLLALLSCNLLSRRVQDLGWCVDDDVNFDFQISFDGKYTIQDAFSGTMCASTLCGVKQVAGSGCAP